MRVLIELPTWLGDTVMATAAIENLINYFDKSEINLIGSLTSIELLKNHPRISNTYVLKKKYTSLFLIPRKIGKFDIFFSFRSSFRSKFLSLLISSSKKFQFDKSKYKNCHQVKKYNDFVNDNLNTNLASSRLILHSISNSGKQSLKRFVGINPGASYGSSKRWQHEDFAKVAIELSSKFDIVIFGGPGEEKIAKKIENLLIKSNVFNFRNLASNTSVDELVNNISILDLFITGDTGPMHIAAAMQVPTVAIFGPTNVTETSQWMNHKSIIVKKNLDCQPCMKRTCPLKHNNCMRLIQPEEVLRSVEALIYDLSL